MDAVSITDVHKSFPGHWGRGGVYAVKGVSLSIPEGGVYGLIGPNGSGKSTVMKMLVGLLAPDAGACRVFGQPATATANRREIGFLPENPYFYKFLTGEETVRFYGRLCGLRGAALKERTRELLELVGPERIVLRLPLIPEFNTEDDRQRSKALLSQMGAVHFDLFTYRTDIKKML